MKNKETAPLVEGGQGRSAESVTQSALLVGLGMALAFVVVIVAWVAGQ